MEFTRESISSAGGIAMIRKDADHYELSNGRTIYAHGGVIGLLHRFDPDADGEFHLTEGWDGYINDYPGEEDRLTIAECLEVADCLIEQWQAYRRRIQLRMTESGGSP